MLSRAAYTYLQISTFRASKTAWFRLSLINALTNTRVRNSDSTKGAVECPLVNFYGDLNRSMRAPMLLFFSLFFYKRIDPAEWIYLFFCFDSPMQTLQAGCIAGHM